jgi:hypothetical protein
MLLPEYYYLYCFSIVHHAWCGGRFIKFDRRVRVPPMLFPFVDSGEESMSFDPDSQCR